MTEMKIELRQVSESTSEASLRNHHVLIDRPEEKGGVDRGPMGGELFLASIGGCFMSNLLAAIRARKAEVSGVRTQVIGTIIEAPARFSAIEVHVTANGAIEEIGQLVEVADKGCIMMNTLREKLPVHLHATSLLTTPTR